MERHIERLSKFCRKCNNNLGTKKTYSKTLGSVSNNINEFYQINVNEESKNVFPERLCRTCYEFLRSLAKLPKNEAADKVKSHPFTIFDPHDVGCELCMPKKSGRKKKDESTSNLTVDDVTRQLDFRPPVCTPAMHIDSIDVDAFTNKDLASTFACNLCNKVNCNQVRVRCCRYLYCRCCLDDHVRFSKSCPNCKTALYDEQSTFLIIEYTDAEATLNGLLRAECHNAYKGCKEVLSVPEAKRHAVDCDFNTVPKVYWTVKPNPIRNKNPLHKVTTKRARERTRDVKATLQQTCTDLQEDFINVLFFLLVQELRATKDSRASTVNALFENKTPDLSIDQCLAMRIENLQSKSQYASQYQFMKTNEVHLLKPPGKLSDREHDYMPPTSKFTIQNPVDSQHPEYFHSPRKIMKASSDPGDLVVVSHLSDSTEPIDVMESFNTNLDELARPNCEGVRWSYPDALAKTLEELDDVIVEGLQKEGIDPSDQSIKLHAVVKDGCDGMGDISVYKKQADVSLPDKAFRFCFCVLNVDVEKEDGTMTRVYTCANPNSVRTNRPLLEAIGDENDRTSCIILLEPIEAERDAMKGNWLNVKVADTNRRYTCNFYTSMIDEKLDRSAGGQEGSGSGHLCTMCEATTETALTRLGEWTITRTHEQASEIADFVTTNPDKLSKAQLKTAARGIKQQPLLRADASKKGYDATHADINMGIFFKKIIVREMANVRTWDVRSDVKETMDQAEAEFDDHIRATIGLSPRLMMPGNYARVLFDEEKSEIVLSKIIDPDRKKLLSDALDKFRFLRKMYRAKNPKEEYPDDIPRIKVVALDLGILFSEDFPYVHWSNYLHKIIEHTEELIETAGTIGGLSGEGIEAGNKLFRFLRANLSRKGNVSEGLRDVLWVHWLYSSPKLQKISEVTSQQQRCSRCLQPGHNRRTCKADLS